MLVPAAAGAAVNAPLPSSATVNPGATEANILFTITDAPARTLQVAASDVGFNCNFPPAPIAGATATVTTDAAGKASGRIDTAGASAGDNIKLTAFDAATQETSVASECQDVDFAATLDSEGSQSGEFIGGDIKMVREFIQSGHAASVHVKSTNTGEATPGVDFIPVDTVVHFPKGQQVVRLDITYMDDKIVESDESIYFEYSDFVALDPASMAPTDLFIRDDDDPPSNPTNPTNPTTPTNPGANTPVTAASKLAALKKAKPRKKVTIAGTATGSPSGVDVAVVQYTKKTKTCRFVKANGSVAVAKKVASLAACAAKGYVAAKYVAAKNQFTRTLAKGLAKGKYSVLSRARSTTGLAEQAFSTKAGNQATLTIG